MPTKTDIYSVRAFDQRSEDDADQAEYDAIIRRSVVVDSGTYDDRIAEALDDFESQLGSQISSWQSDDLKYEGAAGRVLEIVEYRARMLGASYPFELVDNRIEHRASEYGLYEFLLAVSLCENVAASRFRDMPRVFEKVFAEILRGYLGVTSGSLRVGDPFERHVGRRFRDAMKLVCDRSREWVWEPDPDLPVDGPSKGDLGLDVVAWKGPLDDRLGSLFIIGQCACGKDWKNKFNDLSVPKLRPWFKPMTYVDPVRAFAVPFFLSRGHVLEAQRNAGLVFDRARLALVAQQMTGDAELRKVTEQAGKLSKLVIKE